MKRFMFQLAVVCAVSLPVHAGEFGTAKEAEALVSKAVMAIKADRDGTLAAITAKDKQWVDRDLYAMVYDKTGKCLAQGSNAKQVGKDMTGLTDADGIEIIKNRLELAATKSKFWQNYKFKDPVSKKVLPKSAYCETAEDLIVCSGIYRR